MTGGVPGRGVVAPRRRAAVVLAVLAADVVAVLVFAALGRRTHAEVGALLGLLRTAGPFLAGLAVAWALTGAWRAPATLRTGLLVWPATVIAGLAVRFAVTGRLPITFVLVVTISLGVLLLGWRAAVAVVPTRGGHRGSRGGDGA